MQKGLLAIVSFSKENLKYGLIPSAILFCKKTCLIELAVQKQDDKANHTNPVVLMPSIENRFLTLGATKRFVFLT